MVKSKTLHHEQDGDEAGGVVTAKQFVQGAYPDADIMSGQGHHNQMAYWIYSEVGGYLSPGATTRHMAWAYAKSYINIIMMDKLES